MRDGLVELHLMLCLNGRKEILHCRCNHSDLSFNFVAPLLSQSISHALLMQSLAMALQVAKVLTNGFVHGNRVACKALGRAFCAEQLAPFPVNLNLERGTAVLRLILEP